MRLARFGIGAHLRTRLAALSTLAKTLIEVIAVVAASTITNYAGTVTNAPLEDPFRQHNWQG